eukprot:6975207-Pyramimonas_sp.AAC.2
MITARLHSRQPHLALGRSRFGSICDHVWLQVGLFPKMDAGRPSWANQLMGIQVTDSVQGATAAAEALLRAAKMDAANMIPEEGCRKEDKSAPPTPIEEALVKAHEARRCRGKRTANSTRWWAKELAANANLKQECKLAGKGYEAQQNFKMIGLASDLWR